MSAECMHLVGRYGAKRKEQLILLHLADWAGADRKVAADIYALADKTGYSLDAICKTLVRYEDRGALEYCGNAEENEAGRRLPILRFIATE